MFSTMINMPIWVAVLVAIFYGLMGAFMGVSIYRKKNSADMESLAEAYDDLEEEYSKLFALYRDILEQYRCIQEKDNEPDSYWRMKLPTPHVIDPDLFPYPVEIVFYDPEDFLKRYEAEHKEESSATLSDSEESK